MKISTIFLSKCIVLEDTTIDGGILIDKNGKIIKIICRDEAVNLISLKEEGEIEEIIDVGENYIMAGLIDSHVHINEPGRTEWEGFETATKAAAAGGFTTIADMPLNSIPPTTTLENLKIKLNSAKNNIFVDVAFWGGVIPGNQEELLKLVDAGVVGFKCFMCPSGVDEFPNVTYNDIELALQYLQNKDSVLAFHAETMCNNSVSNDIDPHKYNSFLNSRTQEMEVNSIKTIINLTSKYNVKTHIVHLSAASALNDIKLAKLQRLPVTVETCHHYLNFCSEEIPDKATQYKCCPPIRDMMNKEELWNGLKEDIIDLVVSDHSPSTADLKLLNVNDKDYGNFILAWGGIASLQFGLPVFFTQLTQRGFSHYDINKYMSRATSKLLKLHTYKGYIRENYDADFVVFDPFASTIINANMIQFKNKITPYMNRTYRGKVKMTVLRGKIIYKDSFPFSKPSGVLLVNKAI